MSDSWLTNFQQVILYFPSLTQIKELMLISRRAQVAVLTMANCPYNIMSHNTPIEVSTFFTRLKILNFPSNYSTLQAKTLPTTLPLIFRGIDSRFFQQFLFSRFGQHILRVSLQKTFITKLPNYIHLLANIKTLVLLESYHPEVTLIMEKTTAQKCILYCGIVELKSIVSRINFKKNSISKFIFIVEKCVYAEELTNVYKDIPSKHQIYVNFLSYSTKQFSFIPRLREPFITSILTDFIDKDEKFINKTINKAQIQSIKIIDTIKEIDYCSQNSFNINFDSVKSVHIACIQSSPFIIGKNVKNLIVEEFHGPLLCDEAQLQNINIKKYFKGSLFIDDTKLKHISISELLFVVWKHCNESMKNTIFISNLLLNSNQMNDIGTPSKNIKVIFECDNSFVLPCFDHIFFGNKSLSISFAHFNTLHFNTFVIDSLTASYWIGESVDFSCIKRISLKSCTIKQLLFQKNIFESIELIHCSIGSIIISSSNLINLERSMFQSIIIEWVSCCTMTQIKSVLCQLKECSSFIKKDCLFKKIECNLNYSN
ncbi:hypothetical protein EDI_129440 [Entamoeba dispar SAW760]|uniref:Uncharacterized protein n=1 Tax=Entamoeba dispar (strain ATCC PRA-260 / SAW760) TaxID=370354 RepID=B0ETK6_ENTDS|nr:uncharacterized protein EDI_129440 [Entamoeba dispar SAW760]EDR22191.1 hypothetical protein EDI_129440 [Entamoeba dispar SAW760]|eukprot:EDR22191.1 hypothetical protein EDI_129440 [Entamoeba dispar SAW760]